MTTKTKKTILLPLVAISLLSMGVIGNIEDVQASILTIVMPTNQNYTEIESTDEGARSFVREQSTISQDGKAQLYAKKTSRDAFGQAEIEFSKTFTVKSGDDIKLTVRGHVDKLYIGSQNAAKDAHFQLFIKLVML